MSKQTNTKTIAIAVTNGAAARTGSVSVLLVKVPEDVSEAAFLEQLEKAQAKRRNSYDASPRAAIDALGRKYGYEVNTMPVGVFIDASRSSWYACAAG